MMALIFALVLAASPGPFCAGYRQGFTAAYCQNHPFCRSAPVPSCPSADDSATWQDGYDRGYTDGERAHPDRH
jgi:hypothetical protein